MTNQEVCLEMSEGQPLTVFQETTLLLDEAFPQRKAGAFRNMPTLCELSGPLDIGALEAAVNLVVNRHSALRSSFVATEGVPILERKARLHVFCRTGLFSSGLYKRMVSSRVSVPFQFVSLNVCPDTSDAPAAAHNDIALLLARANSTQFDYARPPLVTSQLVRLTSELHYFFFICHVLVSDRISTGTLLKELAIAYAAAKGHSPNSVQSVPASHEFPYWRSTNPVSSGRQPAIEFWIQQWKAFGGSTVFAGAGESTASPSIGTASRSEMMCEQALSHRVLRFCDSRSVTPFILMLAALVIASRRRTDGTPVVIWTTFANRNAGNRYRIGHYETDLFIGFDVPLTGTSAELLMLVSDAFEEVSRFQDFRISLLWRALGGRPSYSRGVQVTFSLFDEFYESNWSMGDITIVRIPTPLLTRRYPCNKLGFSVVRCGPCFKLQLTYALERMAMDVAQSFLEDWKDALIRLLINESDL